MPILIKVCNLLVQTVWAVVWIYVFYVDVFIGTNLLMNGTILLIVKEFRKIYRRHIYLRIVFSAAAGAAIETGMLFFMKNYALYLVLSHIFVIPAMVLLAFGFGSAAVFAATSLTGYLAAILLGGVTMALENLLPVKEMTVLSGVAGGLLVSGILRYLYASVRRGKNLYQVCLYQGKCCYRGMGLWDTGNLLTEPIRQQPVHIVSKEILRKLDIDVERPVAVAAYESLGQEAGAISVYQVQRMEIDCGKKRIVRQEVLLADGGEEFLKKKEYRMIINPTGLEYEIGKGESKACG